MCANHCLQEIDEMPETKLVLCDCLGTQNIDANALEKATGASCSKIYTNLCGKQSTIAQAAIEAGNVTIACQQERHYFEEIAEELGTETPAFLDLRDRAGWTADKNDINPKMAVLLADAMLPEPKIKTVDVESAGTCLIRGDAETALGTARKLCEMLSVTVLLAPDEDPGIFDHRGFDIVKGELANASGALGNFEVTINSFQERLVAGRGDPSFSESKDGARAHCDIILDLSGDTPLFSAHEKREGYLRADPGNVDGVFAAILEASQLVGTFEKPLYVRLDSQLCAHSRAGQTGCARCLDICPTGAITPSGDHVDVNAMICAGCGACSAVCPSGAVSYDAPPTSDTFRRIEAMTSTWRKLSPQAPRLLVHDSGYGDEIIRLCARYGKGLPADLIPMQVAALAAFGHAEMLAALASGFSQVMLLAAPRAEIDGLPFEIELANAIASDELVALIEPGDPDALEELIWIENVKTHKVEPILPLGTRRQITRLAAKTLNGKTPIVPLPEKAPYGTLNLNKDACTLCLSCVSLCPSGALGENPDQPQLRFQEDACLQCGICANICPESAISLETRLNLTDEALSQQVLHEEEPFACIECGALFGVKSTVMRITEKLAGNHSMFANPDAVKMIQMCDNCRVNASYHSDNNPFAQGTVPKPRTTDDYH